MKECDILLKTTDEYLSVFLSTINKDNRAQNSVIIIKSLRDFVEQVVMKIYCDDNSCDLDLNHWDTRNKAMDYCSSKAKYLFLVTFIDKHLNASSGHQTLSKQYAEAIFLIYFDTLLKIKELLKKDYSFDVLKNINKYPLDLDDTFLNHYRKIWDVLNQPENNNKEIMSDLFYVQKKKRIFFDGHFMYELILTPPSDKNDKFDRFVAFSKIDVFPNYAIKANIIEKTIEVFNTKISIKIITDYNVSIRRCEFENLAYILNIQTSINRSQIEYKYLMEFIKKYHISLSSFLDFSNEKLKSIEKHLKEKRANVFPIINLIIQAKKITDKKLTGSNILRYLFYSMNNRILKAQSLNTSNKQISNLKLHNGTLFFDEFPFCCNLRDSKQSFNDVYQCIDLIGNKSQLLKKEITNESDETGKLYTNVKQIEFDGEIDNAINEFNGKLTSHTQSLKISKYSNYIFSQSSEDSTRFIISELFKKTKKHILGYKNQATVWIDSNPLEIDSPEKKKLLPKMFDQSTVFLLYGAAGTGKSTLTKYLFKLFGNVRKLCLAPTHPALENMKRKIGDRSSTYRTVQSFVKNQNINSLEYDIVVIDECSVIDNRLMEMFLKCIKSKILLLTGDTFQLPSIEFGNWFHITKDFLPNFSKHELLEQHRTDDDVLKALWKKVRAFDDDLAMFLSNHHLVHNLDEQLFEKKENDEVVLCLNYDGLFGVNNINLYFQANNPNPAFHWYQYTFKVGDPILFSDIHRFESIIYNNLKGVIKNIETKEDRITFTISIERTLSEMNFRYTDIEYLGNDGTWTIVRFSVFKHGLDDYDKGTNVRYLIPFHIAYAVSIHKAQGLEFNSVKVVIANNVEEKINHNVFYTAITRAKHKLMIYWTPETEKNVLTNFKERFSNKDSAILKSKWPHQD